MSSKHARLGRFLASARTRAALSLGVVLAVGSTGTLAYWTDNATVDGITFTAGTIDLQVDEADSIPDYAKLDLSNMVPGNSMAASLKIKNNGTAPLKYTATSSATPAVLSGALDVKVTSAGAPTGTAPNMSCAGDHLTWAQTTLGGPLLARNPSPNSQLQAGATDTVCIQVTLPSGANTILQGATSTVSLTFTGTSDVS
jgi:predicted ribosomally synthesized peptide with SipW-like signal peptide